MAPEPGTDRRSKTDLGAGLSRRIAVYRFLAKTVLILEQLAPALLMPLSVIALYMAFAWFGFFRLMPPAMVKPVAVLFLLAFVWSLRNFFRISMPGDQEALRRLEEKSELRHRALTSLNDRPAAHDAFSDALWREHQRRLASSVKSLDAGLPRPGISAYDPYGLRAIPVLALFVAFGFSWSNQAGRLADPFHITGEIPQVAGLRVDAWVTPPVYTHKPPIFLTQGAETASQDALMVPAGSVATVRLSGEKTDAPVTFTPAGGGAPMSLTPEKAALDDNDSGKGGTFTMPLTTAGRLEVDGRHWTFGIVKDLPPQIAFDGEPQRALNGALEIRFSAHDDYGVQSAHAIIEPANPDGSAIPLYPPPEFRLELPHRDARDAKGLTSRDLTEHPLSGKPVKVTLVAIDAAGQQGKSETREIVLPARNFREPLAAAAAEERQVFALDERKLGRAIELNEALFLRPESTIPDLTQFLLLKTAGDRMKLARNEDDLKDAADYLWQIALGIDGGDVANAERKVKDAQQALADALNRNASDAEIRKLMNDLRKAMDEFMQALAKQMQSDTNQNQMSADRQKMLRQQDLEKMMDEIQKLAESGSRDEARNLLNQMQRMMNNLQTARPGNRNNPANDKMRQQLDKLGNLLQEQKKLMDETFSKEQALRDRMQLGDPDTDNRNGQMFEDQPMPGSPNDGAENRDRKPGNPDDQLTQEQLRQALKELSKRQQRLERDLKELGEGLRKFGIKPGDGFADAGREMKDATGALDKGQGEAAIGSQGRALEALRKGASDLLKQLAQNGNGSGGQSMPGRQGYDPLGRPQATTGPDFGEDVKVPDEFDAERARQILEAIRRKLGNNLSPELEKQYLERLLDMQ